MDTQPELQIQEEGEAPGRHIVGSVARTFQPLPGLDLGLGCVSSSPRWRGTALRITLWPNAARDQGGLWEYILQLSP